MNFKLFQSFTQIRRTRSSGRLKIARLASSTSSSRSAFGRRRRRPRARPGVCNFPCPISKILVHHSSSKRKNSMKRNINAQTHQRTATPTGRGAPRRFIRRLESLVVESRAARRRGTPPRRRRAVGACITHKLRFSAHSLRRPCHSRRRRARARVASSREVGSRGHRAGRGVNVRERATSSAVRRAKMGGNGRTSSRRGFRALATVALVVVVASLAHSCQGLTFNRCERGCSASAGRGAMRLRRRVRLRGGMGGTCVRCSHAIGGERVALWMGRRGTSTTPPGRRTTKSTSKTSWSTRERT